MDGIIVTRAAVVAAQTVTLSYMAAPTTLTIDRTAPDRLRLSGQLDGQSVTMTLGRLDLDRLRRHDFHWALQYPDIP
jgi:hypothetical protein